MDSQEGVDWRLYLRIEGDADGLLGGGGQRPCQAARGGVVEGQGRRGWGPREALLSGRTVGGGVVIVGSRITD